MHRYVALFFGITVTHFVFADNAVMIAWASMHRFLAGDTDDYTVELRRKWSIEELDPSAPAILDE